MNPAQTLPTQSLIASVGVQCHPGSVRTENQDRISRASTSFGDMYVVADGVGGYQGGAEAAQATVDGFTLGLEAHLSLSVGDALTAAAQAINYELDERARSQDPPVKMSSTVVIALIKGSTATIAHIGDSRAYLVRNGSLRQVTRDHSVVQRLIDQGMVDASHAGEHPSASVLTQALGQSTEVHLELVNIDLFPGDALLLCSDGLWGYASTDEIETIVTAKELSPSACAEALLNVALRAGGGDNISIQFLKFSAPALMVAPPKRMLGLPPKALLGAAVALFLVATSYGTYRVVKQWPHSDVSTKLADAAKEQSIGSGAATPAAVAKAPPRKTENANSKKIRVYVIEGGADEWENKLSRLDYVEIAHADTSPGGTCRGHEEDHPILLFKLTVAADAKKIAKDLNFENTKSMAAANKDCGAGEIFAMPAKQLVNESVITRGQDEVKRARDNMKKDLPFPKP